MERTESELNAGLEWVKASPMVEGTVEAIVIRPKTDERVSLEAGSLSPERGLHGDAWERGCWLSLPDGRPHPDVQITIINSRFIDLVAGDRERWALAGDQLYLDLDLSRTNLPPGQQLLVGQAKLEITPQPHNGCAKFAKRFGKAALAFMSSPTGQELRLRGIYAKVVEAGGVKIGDRVRKLNL